MNSRSDQNLFLSYKQYLEIPSFFSLDCYTLLSLAGEDSQSFLHSITTSDLYHLGVGSIKPTAILDKASRVVFLFFIVCKSKDHYFLIVNTDESYALKQHVEKFIFSEKVAMEIYVGNSLVLAFSHNNLTFLFHKDFKFLAQLNNFSFFPDFFAPPMFVFRIDALGEPCIFFFFPDDCDMNERDAKLNQIFSCKMVEKSAKVWNAMCFDAGFLLHRACYPLGGLLNQLGKERALVAIAKGCYPGQEVVERIKTQNKLSSHYFRALFLEEKDKKNIVEILSRMDKIFFQEKLVGEVVGVQYSFFYDSFVVIARLARIFIRDFNHCTLKINNFLFDATSIIKIPFYYHTETERVLLEYYQKGMTFFHQNQYDEAKNTFSVALNIESGYWEKAYSKLLEALAVISEKVGDTIKAIELNRLFSYYEPNAIMPHTNLSRLFMLAGKIEIAEKEKNLAIIKQFRQTAKGDEEKNLQQIKSATMAKKKMFLEILSHDVHDEIALFSLGKLYFEEENYGEAKKMLKKLLEIKEEHSLGWFFFAKSLIHLKEMDAAKIALEHGIAVAKKLGEILPLKAMQEQQTKIV